jgi:hypothetical protein
MRRRFQKLLSRPLKTPIKSGPNLKLITFLYQMEFWRTTGLTGPAATDQIPECLGSLAPNASARCDDFMLLQRPGGAWPESQIDEQARTMLSYS